MTSSFEGQSALVVGGASGIGRATARLLAVRGARVACLDRDGAAAEAVASELTSAGRTAISIEADVVDPASIHAGVARVIEHFGQLHAVVNCAGISGPTGVDSHEVDLDDLDEVYRVNLRGALVVSQAVILHMLEHGYGRIAHVASIAGKEGNPGMVAYSATKAGLIGMVKALGKEYAKTGITINALAPAVIRTAMVEQQPKELVDSTARIPMGRPGEPEEAAEMLCWMVSPACSFTTGFTFDLSGGRATY